MFFFLKRTTPKHATNTIWHPPKQHPQKVRSPTPAFEPLRPEDAALIQAVQEHRIEEAAHLYHEQGAQLRPNAQGHDAAFYLLRALRSRWCNGDVRWDWAPDALLLWGWYRTHLEVLHRSVAAWQQWDPRSAVREAALREGSFWAGLPPHVVDQLHERTQTPTHRSVFLSTGKRSLQILTQRYPCAQENKERFWQTLKAMKKKHPELGVFLGHLRFLFDLPVVEKTTLGEVMIALCLACHDQDHAWLPLKEKGWWGCVRRLAAQEWPEQCSRKRWACSLAYHCVVEAQKMGVRGCVVANHFVGVIQEKQRIWQALSTTACFDRLSEVDRLLLEEIPHDYLIWHEKRGNQLKAFAQEHQEPYLTGGVPWTWLNEEEVLLLAQDHQHHHTQMEPRFDRISCPEVFSSVTP